MRGRKGREGKREGKRDEWGSVGREMGKGGKGKGWEIRGIMYGRLGRKGRKWEGEEGKGKKGKGWGREWDEKKRMGREGRCVEMIKMGRGIEWKCAGGERRKGEEKK